MNEMLPWVANGYALVTLMFFDIWVVHLLIRNAGIVDVGWGIGFIVLAAVYVVGGAGFNLRNSLLLVMVALWGLRIAFFLLKRIIHEGQEDKRYQRMRKQWGRWLSLKFLLFFEFQALLQVIIALPFILVAFNSQPRLSVFEIAGALVFFVALWGEALADEQLHAFKANPKNKGKTCDVGLWLYSRHPNYFCEWLVWVAFFVYALGSPMGWLAVISPVIMYLLMIYVSGVPLAEQQALESRGEDYHRYQQTTSMFFPWPKKTA